MASNLQALKDAADNKPRPSTETDKFRGFLTRYQDQFAQVLPAHLNAERMVRLAVSEFAKNKQLQQAEPRSLVSSIMTAATLGLEIGVLGQGYLVPYNDSRNQRVLAQFIPGWKGLVDLVSRAGRATVWTGAVFHGDSFDYALGDSPFVRHRPGDEDDPTKLTHVYAIGRVNGSQYPVIEVWTIEKVKRHRDKYNKVGSRHYSFDNWEMYARKVPLLQVLKYMPASVELSNAMGLDAAHESGKHAALDGQFLEVDEDDAPSENPAPTSKPAAARAPAATENHPAPKAEPEAKAQKTEKEAAVTPSKKAPQERPPLFEQFTNALARCESTKDTETAYLVLDEARSLIADMTDEEKARAEPLYAAATEDLKAR